MTAENTSPTAGAASTNPLMDLLTATRRRPVDPHDVRPMILFLCTGNAARSVMAAAMMRALLGSDSPFIVWSGGTHVLPGQPMSVRTRRALERHGLKDPWHRSHQMTEADVERASLIVAMEPMHVAWMQRTYQQGVVITGSLPRLAKNFPRVSAAVSKNSVGRESFDARVASMDLGAGQPDVWAEWEEIIDPASGEQADFDECSDAIDVLIRELHAAIL